MIEAFNDSLRQAAMAKSENYRPRRSLGEGFAYFHWQIAWLGGGPSCSGNGSLCRNCVLEWRALQRETRG
jgi:hypothetical protein